MCRRENDLAGIERDQHREADSVRGAKQFENQDHPGRLTMVDKLLSDSAQYFGIETSPEPEAKMCGDCWLEHGTPWYSECRHSELLAQACASI